MAWRQGQRSSRKVWGAPTVRRDAKAFYGAVQFWVLPCLTQTCPALHAVPLQVHRLLTQSTLLPEPQSDAWLHVRVPASLPPITAEAPPEETDIVPPELLDDVVPPVKVPPVPVPEEPAVPPRFQSPPVELTDDIPPETASDDVPP
jgi:hypothetical protein